MKLKDHDEIAVFRYSVIAPLRVDVEDGLGLKAAIERIAASWHVHPEKGRIRIQPKTIEGWYYAYRKDGFDGLLPKRREDAGQSRKITPEIAEKIEALAKSRPEIGGIGILAEIKTMDPAAAALSTSTLYRFLRAKGLDLRAGPPRKDHRAYGFEEPGDCWQCDVMHGPKLAMPDGTRRRVYLIAILDDATRIICHAQFYFTDDLRSLKDCLKQALLKRGRPKRLYFDNGKIFRSRMILLLTARLGIHLIHSRPYRPQGRAKLERWFGTVRRSFLPRVDIDKVAGIDALNRLFFAWIKGEYHVTPHRGLNGDTPKDRWTKGCEAVRPLQRDIDLDKAFYEEVTRRVAKDGTLTLNGGVFEAGPIFIGQRVTVRFDPFDLRRIDVFGANDRHVEAYPVDLERNSRIRRNPEQDATPQRIELRSLEALAAAIESTADQNTNQETKHGR